MDNQNIPVPPKMTQEDKSFVKYLIVSALLLLLWAVLQLVNVQVSDREKYMDETMAEVGKTWSGQQYVYGPCISYDKTLYDTVRHYKPKGDSIEVVKSLKTYYLFPQNLEIEGNIEDKTLHRAIYDVNVYSFSADVKGNFDVGVLNDPNVRNSKLMFYVSDLRGIFEPVVISMDSLSLELTPFQGKSGWLYSPIKPVKGSKMLPFSLKLGLKGSNSLMFRPYGDNTSVSLKSGYANPSFKGDFLPIERNVSDKGFDANWKVLKINRQSPDDVSFGVDLIKPVTQYQMTARSIKYGILVILLVFLAAIVVELFTKKRINVLQYAVVGLSLVLFYLLLLSFSDFISFGWAYLLAAVMTSLALTAYFRGILRHKAGYLLGGLAFLFLMISFGMMQMQVYSLLTGSLLLFAILCVIMYLTRNMNSNNNQ